MIKGYAHYSHTFIRGNSLQDLGPAISETFTHSGGTSKLNFGVSQRKWCFKTLAFGEHLNRTDVLGACLLFQFCFVCLTHDFLMLHVHNKKVSHLLRLSPSFNTCYFTEHEEAECYYISYLLFAVIIPPLMVWSINELCALICCCKLLL